MASRLDQIVEHVRARVSETKVRSNMSDLERRAAEHEPRGFGRALQKKGKNGIAVIAELKKASPSKGLIRPNFAPGSLAKEMAEAGAAALSVLTEDFFFQGSLENLSIASAATGLPCLRKDFILDEFQLLEARAFGADAALLIMAALSPDALERLVRRSVELDMDVLCEVHDEDELKRALDAGCNLIGVNTRDLHSFKVDLHTAERLSGLIPKEVVSVAESGIHSGGDILRLRAAGYQAFLIGESLMRAERPGDALRALMKEAKAAVSSFQTR